jgi:hypothetical protein
MNPRVCCFNRETPANCQPRAAPMYPSCRELASSGACRTQPVPRSLILLWRSQLYQQIGGPTLNTQSSFPETSLNVHCIHYIPSGQWPWLTSLQSTRSLGNLTWQFGISTGRHAWWPKGHMLGNYIYIYIWLYMCVYDIQWNDMTWYYVNGILSHSFSMSQRDFFAGHLRFLEVQGSDWCQSALDREFLAETCRTTKIDIVEAWENYVGNLEI